MKLEFHLLTSDAFKTGLNALKGLLLFVIGGGLPVALVLGLPIAANGAGTGEAFTTPEDAAAALKAAVTSQNTADLRNIFGPAVDDIENPDRVQATNELAEFADALRAGNRIVHESGTKCVIEAGTNAWPFPVPVVKQGGQWYFDTAAGRDEILNRRIGGNELEVLKVVRAYVDSQRDYASGDRDGDGVLQYAQRLASSPGKKDGLYWPPELDGELSPLGPLVADAQAEGYKVKVQGQEITHAPFHGYLFKILTRQGADAAGGKYNYVINGHMIGGFALVAWPAEYGNSGIMTFIVNQQGRVYQQDLGPQTAKLATEMKTYNPDRGWSVSAD